MFKQSQRFSFRNGAPKQKIITPLYILRFQKSDAPRYAVVAGKVVSKKAVLRNRTKRIFIVALKEVFEKSTVSCDLVFFLRRPYTEYTKSAIIAELQDLLGKLNTLQTT